jgi:hypothetical protein
MTIDEFKAVVAIGNMQIIAKRDWRKQLYDAFINQDKLVFAPRSPIFSGHTEKAALKKLKDWYHYEGRKNGNR